LKVILCYTPIILDSDFDEEILAYKNKRNNKEIFNNLTRTELNFFQADTGFDLTVFSIN